MAEVKWIKIVTDVFDDEKILLIETLPEADSLIVIWFKLLCLAGKQNNNGVFLMNDRIPYTEEMLAAIFRRPLSTVKLALKTFEDFGMIEVVDGVIVIPNWDKHQSLDKLEMAREQTRKRVAKHREKQKLIALGEGKEEDVTQCNVTEVLHVTQSNADREDKIRLEEDKNRKDKEKKKKTKHKYGEYKNVLLTDDEYNKLLVQYGQVNLDKIITYFDKELEMKDYKYKSHYLVILKWAAKAALEQRSKEGISIFKSFLES